MNKSKYYYNDTYLQNKIKLIIQNYYYRKYKKTKHNDILSPETIAYSTGCKKRNHNNESERYENKNKHSKQRLKLSGEKSSKYKIKGKKSQNNILSEQINTNENENLKNALNDKLCVNKKLFDEKLCLENHLKSKKDEITDLTNKLNNLNNRVNSTENDKDNLTSTINNLNDIKLNQKNKIEELVDDNKEK